MDKKQRTALLFAILAAALYAVSVPFAKLLLADLSPTLMAAFLYLGAGIGMSVMGLVRKKLGRADREAHLSKGDLPFIIAMVLLDIAAPCSLMLGLKWTSAANASLLNNFEIVATSLIALVFFQEVIRRRLWLAIFLITAASVILSIGDDSSLNFSWGSLLVLLACVFWGFENNCTRMLSLKDPLEVVVIKGFGSGLGSLLIALGLGNSFAAFGYVAAALVLGFVAYGLSIFFYVYAQRELGAAKTSAFYAVSPFIGAGLSLLIFREVPAASFWVALLFMIAGAYFATADTRAGTKEAGR